MITIRIFFIRRFLIIVFTIIRRIWVYIMLIKGITIFFFHFIWISIGGTILDSGQGSLDLFLKG